AADSLYWCPAERKGSGAPLSLPRASRRGPPRPPRRPTPRRSAGLPPPPRRPFRRENSDDPPSGLTSYKPPRSRTNLACSELARRLPPRKRFCARTFAARPPGRSGPASAALLIGMRRSTYRCLMPGKRVGSGPEYSPGSRKRDLAVAILLVFASARRASGDRDTGGHQRRDPGHGAYWLLATTEMRRTARSAARATSLSASRVISCSSGNAAGSPVVQT